MRFPPRCRPSRSAVFAGVVAALWLGAWVAPAAAQQPGPPAPASTAGAVQQGARQTNQYERLQRQLRNPGTGTRPEISRPTTPAPAGGATGPSFLLSRIVTTHSSILTPAEIARVVRPYEHRRVTIADLHRAVAAINRLYAQKGIVTARAVLPRQRVVNGVVRIQLIEARLDRILIVGADHTPSGFYRARIHARSGDLLRLNQLNRDLILLNTGNGVQARALLRPGSKFGTTDLIVEVHEPPRLSLTPTLDNAGRASIGLQRLGLSAADNNLFGDRDTLSFGASWATGTHSFNLAYNAPLDTSGTRMTIAADYAGIRILSGQLKTFGVTGNSVDFSLGLTHPLYVREGLVLSGVASFHLLRSKTTSAGLAISNQFVQAGELGANLQWFDRQGAWIAADSFDFGTVNVAGHGGFGKDSLSVARIENMGGGFSGILRFAGQTRVFAPASGLPLVEQLQLGGLSTVRGYPQGWQIGDTGYSLTTELDFPLPLRQYFFGGAFSRGLEGAIFTDHGGVFGLPGVHSGPHATPRDLYLTSSGLGIVFNTPYLSGRLDWAAPIENRAGLPKVGFDFYLQPRLQPSWFAFWRHGAG